MRQEKEASITLISGASIFTGQEDNDILDNAAVAFSGDRILAVGPDETISPSYGDATVVPAEGKLVLPGLINTHAHLIQNIERGMFEDTNLRKAYPFPVRPPALLGREERQVIAKLGAAEAIRNGTTCLWEIFFDVPDYAETLNSTGLRLILSESLNDMDHPSALTRNLFSPTSRETGVENRLELLERFPRQKGRVMGALAIHAPDTCSPEFLKQTRGLAERYGVPYTINLCQSQEEVEIVKATRGVRPTQYLAQCDFLSSNLVASHCWFADDSEISLLGDSEANMAHDAAFGARRGLVPRIGVLEGSGVSVTIATDSQAVDTLEALRLALLMERVRCGHEHSPEPRDSLKWATVNGAKALGLEEQIGTLEAGMKADLIVVDLGRPHLVPSPNLLANFVYYGQLSDIEAVVVDGEWLMRDHRLLTIDEADIVRRAEEISRSLWRRMIDEYGGREVPPLVRAYAAPVQQ